MNKITIPMISIILLLISLIIPTSATYVKSIQLNTGSIEAEEPNEKPLPPSKTIAHIHNSLTVSSGTIDSETEVVHGPITLYGPNGKLNGNVLVNPWVSISGLEQINGPIIREEIHEKKVTFDYSILPKNIPSYGDYNIHESTTINSSGQYYNFNLNNTLTIDTSNGDIVLMINHLNLGGDIKVKGTNRAIIIIKDNININGNRKIGSPTMQDKLDLVIQNYSLNIQNHMNLYASLYFEGSWLTIRNHINIEGAIYAPNANVTLSEVTLSGAIYCNALSMEQNSRIIDKSIANSK